MLMRKSRAYTRFSGYGSLLKQHLMDNDPPLVFWSKLMPIDLSSLTYSSRSSVLMSNTALTKTPRRCRFNHSPQTSCPLAFCLNKLHSCPRLPTCIGGIALNRLRILLYRFLQGANATQIQTVDGSTRRELKNNFVVNSAFPNSGIPNAVQNIFADVATKKGNRRRRALYQTDPSAARPLLENSVRFVSSKRIICGRFAAKFGVRVFGSDRNWRYKRFAPPFCFSWSLSGGASDKCV